MTLDHLTKPGRKAFTKMFFYYFDYKEWEKLKGKRGMILTPVELSITCFVSAHCSSLKSPCWRMAFIFCFNKKNKEKWWLIRQTQ